jgi:nitroreductase
MTGADDLARLRATLDARSSSRAYLPDPLDRGALDELFAAAQRAPSWCNTQPWQVVVTAPPVTGEFSRALLEAAGAGLPAPDIPFPGAYPEPYAARRRECGVQLYGAMGVTRDDRDGRHRAWLRNYELFDAPHLAVVSRERSLGEYATLDVGVWLGVLLTAAAAMGVATCPMASVAAYPAPLRRLLGIAETHVILFGIALGRADGSAPANACRTGRAPLSDNVRFLGFPH